MEKLEEILDKFPSFGERVESRLTLFPGMFLPFFGLKRKKESLNFFKKAKIGTFSGRFCQFLAIKTLKRQDSGKTLKKANIGTFSGRFAFFFRIRDKIPNFGTAERYV